MTDVSVLIPSKNGVNYIRECLDAVYGQEFDGSVEVILVDSGSTDGMLDIVRLYPVKLYEIQPESFHHARTRNYLASLASGKYLVYLSQDAFPASNQWLRALISSFEDPRVAAVYGRHLPKPGCTSERKAVLASAYGDQKIVKEISRKIELGYRCYHFSTVNAAIRRDVWERIHFPEDLPVYEDIAISVEMLKEGWRIVYEPTARVYHSHNFDGKALFRRYFDTGVVYQRLHLWEDGGGSSMLSEGFRMVRRKIVGTSSNGTEADNAVWVSIGYDIAKCIALFLGRNERFLPTRAKQRLSAHKLFGEIEFTTPTASSIGRVHSEENYDKQL
jgi:rhamnosyltransferase